MTYSRRMKLAPIWITLAIALAIVLAVGLATPRPAGAAIHEIIAALCNGRGETVPPGQVKAGQSFVRALQATGFIVSIDENPPVLVTITFDPTVPNSKFRDAGVGNVLEEDFFGPDFDLLLVPGIEPDPDFPAHANCSNFGFFD